MTSKETNGSDLLLAAAWAALNGMPFLIQIPAGVNRCACDTMTRCCQPLGGGADARYFKPPGKRFTL
jgi:hypothetical protein